MPKVAIVHRSELARIRFLTKRLESYLSKGQGVLAMRRPGAAHMPNKSFASRIA